MVAVKWTDRLRYVEIPGIIINLFLGNIGKTLLAKTLARVLDVPFSVSDATTFTQVSLYPHRFQDVRHTQRIIGRVYVLYVHCARVSDAR